MSSTGAGIELHVTDFVPVKEFYGTLGFEVVWENSQSDKAGYLVMRMNDVVLRFWPGNSAAIDHSYFGEFPVDTPRGYGVEIVIAVDDVAKFYSRAAELGAVITGLAKKPWGLSDFRIVDPFGYYLRFTEHHDVTAPDYGGRPS
jgi:lactoylglutathione lyase